MFAMWLPYVSLVVETVGVCCCFAAAAVTIRYIKFDTFHPAVSKGLPVTRVISRITLQVNEVTLTAADGTHTPRGCVVAAAVPDSISSSWTTVRL